MAKQISFDPDALQTAADELSRLVSLLDHDLDWSHLEDASNIKGDLSSLNEHDDKHHAWSWVEKHTSDICGYVSARTNDVKAEAIKIRDQMQSTINTLSASEDDNKRMLNKAGND